MYLVDLQWSVHETQTLTSYKTAYKVVGNKSKHVLLPVTQ